MTPDLSTGIEPADWFVCFHVGSATRWLGLITPGRFKHVSAIGYCAGGAWMIYDVRLCGTILMLIDEATALRWTHGCTVVKIARVRQHMGLSSRIGFTCVNSVKHLLRLGCVAVTPDQLYRHILRNGGIVISECRSAARESAGPCTRAGAGPGAG